MDAPVEQLDAYFALSPLEPMETIEERELGSRAVVCFEERMWPNTSRNMIKARAYRATGTKPTDCFAKREERR